MALHEAWKPTAYDKRLHERMGTSYATNTFQTVRLALRREMLLALMRIWDKDPRALRMDETIGKSIRDPKTIDALVANTVARIGIEEAEQTIRDSLSEKANEATAIIDKYSKHGPQQEVRKALEQLRHQQLAHRQVAISVEELTATDEQIEQFYQDNSNLIRLLLSLVHATAYDPDEGAQVFRRYASEFWAGVSGERTTGHPNFRPPKTPTAA